MQRLTERNKCGDAYYPECYDHCMGEGASEKCNDCEYDKKLCDTLAAYEDTGRTPEQIRELADRDTPHKIEINAGIPTCPVCGRRVSRYAGCRQRSI